VTTVLNVPPSLDDDSFEPMLQPLDGLAADAKLLIDARHAKWSSPYGLVGLLTLAQSRAVRPQFLPPEDAETASYWARAGFFRNIESMVACDRPLPRSRSGDSNFFLEITPVVRTEDVQHVVAHIQDRSTAIITTLGLPASASIGFSVVLSETCQNIIEHAGAPGWVAVQTYNRQRRLARRGVVIAVSDGGVGFRQSLAQSTARASTDRWDDAAALEAALLRAVSRFRDPGRGQGLHGIRRYMNKWGAKLTIRSGTARIGVIPDWDHDKPLVEHLTPFPGSQVQIIIPSVAAA
jgi:anti-sigma regulatory factor (Ser/Thr protein kinase)